MQCGGTFLSIVGLSFIPTVGAISINLGKANFRSVPFVLSHCTEYPHGTHDSLHAYHYSRHDYYDSPPLY